MGTQYCRLLFPRGLCQRAQRAQIQSLRPKRHPIPYRCTSFDQGPIGFGQKQCTIGKRVLFGTKTVWQSRYRSCPQKHIQDQFTLLQSQPYPIGGENGNLTLDQCLGLMSPYPREKLQLGLLPGLLSRQCCQDNPPGFGVEFDTLSFIPSDYKAESSNA